MTKQEFINRHYNALRSLAKEMKEQNQESITFRTEYGTIYIELDENIED